MNCPKHMEFVQIKQRTGALWGVSIVHTDVELALRSKARLDENELSVRENGARHHLQECPPESSAAFSLRDAAREFVLQDENDTNLRRHCAHG